MNELTKKSESRLRSIINNISDLLLILKRKNGLLLFENANDNFCKAFSINKSESNKKEINAVLEGKLLEEIIEHIKKFDHPSAHSIKFQYNSDGFRHYSVKISYIDDKLEDERIYIVSLQDISDQYLYQEQLKKAYDKETNLNKLKTSFLENMSHEIRTPLNAILGYSEIIDESVKMSDFDTVSELTSSVKDVLHRVVNLFGNIVEVFQIDSGEAQLEREYFDCNAVLKAVCNKKIKEADNKGLDFNMLIDHTPLYIVADPSKLDKVIFSLVDNSIKYTDSGEILVASKLVGNEINLIIADTGKGIKEHELNRMLEPFTQEEEGYFRNYEGAGLGLTVAYKLTNLMGGKFDIKSKEKKGTKITITFPVQKAPLS